MISLAKYRKYWEEMAAGIEGISDVLPVTVDDQMGRKIQSLLLNSCTLFVMPPLAESKARTADDYREKCNCVVFVMAKYDPQRIDSFSLLEQTQPIIEEIKRRLLNDLTSGCSPMRLDVSSIETAPETELYGRFAGWSIMFVAE